MKSEIFKKNGLFCQINLSLEYSIRCPDLCFILFEIFSKHELFSNERIACYCIPFNRIREGYRIVFLFIIVLTKINIGFEQLFEYSKKGCSNIFLLYIFDNVEKFVCFINKIINFQ